MAWLLWRSLKNLKTKQPYDLTIPLPGVYLKEFRSGSQGDTGTPVFTAALCPIAKICKQTTCL